MAHLAPLAAPMVRALLCM